MPQPAAAFTSKPSFALLLIGPPFTGKTNIAFQFPDPYVLDFDDKMLNAVSRYPGKQFWWDSPYRKPDGGPVPEIERWEYAAKCLNAAFVDPLIKTIVLDSGTAMCALIKKHIMRFPTPGTKGPLMVGNEQVMEMTQWQPFQDIIRRTILGCRASGKLLVFIVHEQFVKDEVTGTYVIKPLIQGAMGDCIAGLFTDCWHAEVDVVADTKRPGFTKAMYRVRTEPTAKLSLGSALLLPAMMDSDKVWQEVGPKLGYTLPPPPINPPLK